jgi:hypothetical protein
MRIAAARPPKPVPTMMALAERFAVAGGMGMEAAILKSLGVLKQRTDDTPMQPCWCPARFMRAAAQDGGSPCMSHGDYLRVAGRLGGGEHLPETLPQVLTPPQPLRYPHVFHVSEALSKPVRGPLAIRRMNDDSCSLGGHQARRLSTSMPNLIVE